LPDARPRAGTPGGRPRARFAAGADGGFSLIEMVIAMTVLTVVMAAAMGVFSSESEAIGEGMDRLEVLQNLRFGANALEKDIKTTGANAPEMQPKLVYADEDVVAFSADFATNVADDDEAVYYDPDAPAEEVEALEEDRKITIPNGTFEYPERDYTVGSGTNSPAETLIFFFRPDSSTDRSDDWALFRQVNDQEPQLVSRHLLRAEGGEPFLEYRKLVTPEDAPERIETVASGDLPMAHDEPIHGSGADEATIDSVRSVRLRMAATNGETGDDEEIRSVSRTIRVPNMGVERKQVCGETPVSVPAFSATPEVDDGSSTVLLEWDASVDQEGGEEDVVRYLVWKRQPSDTEWGPPLLALPVGGDEYSYRDTQVVPDEEYEYGVAAQDCTPEQSPISTAGPVEAPDPSAGGGGGSGGGSDGGDDGDEDGDEDGD
ncbi:MAG: prepilin-type N-terminal cleavage/methylation domain-containing protein, partial [Gemmatimonadota bacterium]